MARISVVGPLILLAIVAGPANGDMSAGSDPCANAANQRELTECVAQEYMKADGKLNDAYEPLLTSLDREHQLRLKAAQRAWIAFRDAECDLRASEALHGSMEKQLRYACLQDVTTARIKDLRALRDTLKDYVR
jgi:uncharacterized protein YecT (DUF1311 family)